MISRRDLVWVPSLTVKKNEVKRMKKKIKAYKRRDNIAGYVMLAPWLFGFVLMYFLPMLISIYYSFTDYNLLNDETVFGFDNYVRI